jgi:hypothetical protein
MLKGSVNRTYDLNALPEGTYFLVAESSLAKYEISIDKRSSGYQKLKAYKPMLVNNNG